MTRWQQVWIVASWEFRRFVKWRQQFVSLAIFLGLGGAWAGFQAVAKRATDRRVEVAATGAATLGFPLPDVPGVTWVADRYVAAETARLAVQQDSVAGALVVTSATTAEIVVRRRAAWIDPMEAALVNARRLAAFASLPLSANDREQLAQPFATRVTTVTATGAPVGRATRIFALVILGFGLTILFTGFATLFTGITGEKTQRITEQMISMVSPQTWMDGKIIGLSGAATAGTAVLAVGGWILMKIIPGALGRAPIELPGVASDIGLLLLVGLVTALGVVMWFSFMSAIAATIDDPNASPRVSLLFVPLLPIFGAFMMLPRADSVFAQVMAIFPLTSMGMLPARLMTTSVPWWEVALGIGLLAATAWLFRRAAGKIFATGVLMYGKEPTMRELWRWAREA